jgi:hypothetical protein
VVALMKTNVVIVAPNNSGTVVGVNYGTITEPQVEAKPPQTIVVMVTNTIIEKYSAKINLDSNWPGQKLPDVSYNLEPGTKEYVIPPRADYAFNPPPPEQGVFRTYPVLIDGNPDMVFIAQNGVRWDRRWNNPQSMPVVHQYRYWNRSSEPARMRMGVVPVSRHR